MKLNVFMSPHEGDGNGYEEVEFIKGDRNGTDGLERKNF